MINISDISQSLNNFIQDHGNEPLSDNTKSYLTDLFSQIQTFDMKERDILATQISINPKIASIVRAALTGTTNDDFATKLRTISLVNELSFMRGSPDDKSKEIATWLEINQGCFTKEAIDLLPYESRIRLTAQLAQLFAELKETYPGIFATLDQRALEFFYSTQSLKDLLANPDPALSKEQHVLFIAEYISSKKIKISDVRITEEQWDTIIPQLSYGDFRGINDDTLISKLLEKGAKLNHIFISNSTIKAIDAPQATTVTLADCPALTALNAPQATTVTLDYCAAITAVNAPQAATVKLVDCYAITALDAPQAATVDLMCCYAITALNAPQAATVTLGNCYAITALNAPQATTVTLGNCYAITALDAPQATTITLTVCRAISAVNAPQATTVTLYHCNALTALNAPQATAVTIENCAAITALNAPQATAVTLNECPALVLVHAPFTGRNSLLAGVVFKMPEVRRLNNADQFEEIHAALVGAGEELPPVFRELITECAFKTSLLKGESVSRFIDAIREKLADPQEAEKVAGELSSFSKWAKEVPEHEHLSQWLFNLKEEVRRSIEAIHTNATFRTLINDHYQEVRESQTQNLQENSSALNLGLFLDNKELRARMRALFSNVAAENLNKLKTKFDSVLDKQLPLLFPEEPDHHARKTKILSFIDRIQRARDYAIDTEGVTKHITAVINSVCIYNSETGIKHNKTYITNILDALYEGAEACENRAADALYKAEEIFLEEKFKNSKGLLYGVVLMQWKRRFIEQYVRQYTLPKILSDLQGSRLVDIEIIMANFQAFDALLDLNLDIKDVLHLDDIKAHLQRLGKPDHVLADPQELFKALMEPQTKEFWLDLFFDSPVIQKLHVVDPNFYHSPQHVKEQAGGLLAQWGRAILDKTGEAGAYLVQLKDILNRYRNMEDFDTLELRFNTGIKALTDMYSGDFDDEVEIEIMDILSTDLSNAQDRYRNDIFENLKGRIADDLIETGYFVKPELKEGQFVLAYPDPANFHVEPSAVIDAVLSLNVQDWPAEFLDAESPQPNQ